MIGSAGIFRNIFSQHKNIPVETITITINEEPIIFEFVNNEIEVIIDEQAII
jgi:hypothetical protein